MVLPQDVNVSPAIAYRIDANDRIVEVSDEWVSFAAENGGVGLRPALVIGHVLWDFLADATTVHLYQAMCKALRRGGPVIQFRFRCDAPDLRRLLAMTMTCGDADSITFKVTSVAQQVRAAIPLMGLSSAISTGPHVTMCGWCKRVRTATAAWVEIEHGIEALGLFQGQARLPAVSHGICDTCELVLSTELDRMTVTLGPLPDLAG